MLDVFEPMEPRSTRHSCVLNLWNHAALDTVDAFEPMEPRRTRCGELGGEPAK